MIHRYNPGHGKGGEYMGMEEDPQGSWCAYDDVAALEKRLAEATALLRMWHAQVIVPGTLARLEAFLSTTPSPPAEPAPSLVAAY